MSRMSAVCVCCPWSCKDCLPIQLYLLHLLQKVRRGFYKKKTTFLTWKACCQNRCDGPPRGSRFLSDCQNLCLHNGTSTSATCEGQTSKERPQQRRDGFLVRVLWLWLRKRSAHGAEGGVPGMSFCLRSFVVLSFPLFFFPGYVLHFVHLLISKLRIALPFPIRQRSWTPPRFVPRTPPGPPPPTPSDILGMVPRTPPLLSPPAPSQLLGSPPRTPESQWAHTL